MRIQRYLIAFGLFLCSQFGRSQGTELIIRSVDDFSYFLKINGEQQSDSLMNIYFAPLKDSRQVVVDIWTKDPGSAGNFTLKLKPGFRYTYELYRIEQGYSLLPFSKSLLPPPPSFEPDTAATPGLEPIPHDVEVLIEQDTSAAQVPAYLGPRGCDFPLSAGEFQSELNAIAGLYFERERRRFIEQLVKEHCITVGQLEQLLHHIELEDVRLEIIASVRDLIYDIEVLPRLSDLFQLSASKSAFDELIAK